MTDPGRHGLWLRRGLGLEYATPGWNVIGVVILAVTALRAGSPALAAFLAMVVYLTAQLAYTLIAGARPDPSPLGVAWTALTFLVMIALAAGKACAGTALDNPVLRTEGRVTLVDAHLAAAVLTGLALNAALDGWWADPAAGQVIVYYGDREAHHALTHTPDPDGA